MTKRLASVLAVALLVTGAGWAHLFGRDPKSASPPMPPLAHQERLTAAVRIAETLPPLPRELRWTSTWVNVREGRSLESPVVQILDPGQQVEVANRRGSWWEARVDGRTIGYLSNAVLEPLPPTRR